MRNSFLHLVLCWSEPATSKVFNSFPWLDLECSTTSAALKKSNWTQQTKKWNHTARKHFYISAYLLLWPDWFDKRMKMMKPWHWTTSFTCCMAILHIIRLLSFNEFSYLKTTLICSNQKNSILCVFPPLTSRLTLKVQAVGFVGQQSPNWTPLLLTSGWNLSHPN